MAKDAGDFVLPCEFDSLEVDDRTGRFLVRFWCEREGVMLPILLGRTAAAEVADAISDEAASDCACFGGECDPDCDCRCHDDDVLG